MILDSLVDLQPPFVLYSTSGDTTPPATPTGLTATNGDGQVVLTWDANGEGDLNDYQIYHSTSAGGPFTVLTTINSPVGFPATTYTHSGLTNGSTHYYKITARDTLGNESAQSSPAVLGEPTANTDADGYYAKHTRMKFRAGIHNLAIYSQLDNDATTEDQDNLQLAMDEADRYVDTRARVLGLTADTGTSAGHMIANDNVYFSRISDLASDIAVALIYSARGFTGDQSNTVEGQMADMDAKARKELDEIFTNGSLVTQRGDAGSDGATVVVAQCRPCEYRGPVNRWGW